MDSGPYFSGWEGFLFFKSEECGLKSLMGAFFFRTKKCMNKHTRKNKQNLVFTCYHLIFNKIES